MYPTGHYGVALLVSAPAAFVLGRRAGTVFSAFVLLTAVLPDVDKHVPGVRHHGVTHTLLFGVASGVVVGLLATGLLVTYVRFAGPVRSSRLTARNAFEWAAAGAFLGVLSHVTADVLVVLPGTQPVSPFWPLFERKITVETIPLGAPARNLALLVVGLGVHVLVYRLTGDGAES
ncbi:metal-dependent hydrolase [Halomicrococcus sp. SG-WS-1]|uniref:metal-dependent hydrolase n=1 Tax=Halomicrococcus sp. SG-WS-1 TaxID=3439057 RepID=UPI003F78EDF1